MEPQWRFQFSVDCAVSPEFAWQYWTTVENWALDLDVESISLDGPFAAGAHGVTMSKSAGRIIWRIADVQPGKAILEFPAPGAIATFTWTFTDLGNCTRITQQASLAGPEATKYIDSFCPSLEQGIPEGMRKLCEAMQAAAPAKTSKLCADH
jgi:hypothetical protein